MKYIFFLSAILIYTGIYSQKKQINYLKSTNWQDIISKAKLDNKGIFVELYATWCVPCKQMELNVLSKQAIIDSINYNFEPIRLQFDSTKSDDSITIRKRQLSQYIVNKYDVNGLPTYLYFNSNGDILEKQTGELTEADFLALTSNVSRKKDPYYILVNSLNKYLIDSASLLRLIRLSSDKNEEKIMVKASKLYLKTYGNTIYINDHFNDSILNILLTALPKSLNSTDPLFLAIVEHTKLLDSLCQTPGYGDYVVCQVLLTDYFVFLQSITPTSSYTPDWNGYYKIISNRFGEYYAGKVVLSAKIQYSKKAQRNKDLAKYSVDQINKYGMDTSSLGLLRANNTLYSVVFKYSMDSKVLNEGANLMKLIVYKTSDPDYMDTYANLLYKSGHRKKALQWEKSACDRHPKDKDLAHNYKLMSENLPTW
jgi:thioredoxin-related protein